MSRPGPESARRSARSFQTDVSLTLVARVVALACGVATTVVIARALGPAGRGEVAVAVSLTLLLVQFGMLGFQTANPFFVAQESSASRRIVWNSVWFSLGIGLILIAAGVALKAVAPDAVRGLDWLEVGLALGAIPAVIASQLLQSVLLGEGRMIAYNVAEVLLAVVALVVLAIGLLVADFGVVGALALIVGVRYVSALTFLFLARAPARAPSRPDLELGRRMLAYGARVYLAALLAFLVIRVDLMLVNGYLGPADAGLYSVAVAIADGMMVLPQVVALNLFARVSQGLETEQSAKVFRMLLVPFAVLCLLAALLAGPAIDLLYGERFAGATELYHWLALGVFSLGMLNVLAHHFAGRGFPIEAALVWFVGLGANLVINLVFLDSEGAYIASLASSVAYTILLALHVRMFARQAGGYGILVPRRSDLSELIGMLRPRSASPS